jgi:hypothetical protein
MVISAKHDTNASIRELRKSRRGYLSLVSFDDKDPDVFKRYKPSQLPMLANGERIIFYGERRSILNANSPLWLVSSPHRWAIISFV